MVEIVIVSPPKPPSVRPETPGEQVEEIDWEERRRRAMLIIQAGIRGWLARARIRIEMRGVVVRYWVKTYHCRARITIKSVRVKRTRTKKTRHLVNN